MDYSVAISYIATFTIVAKNSIATTYFMVISVNATFKSVANGFVTTRCFHDNRNAQKSGKKVHILQPLLKVVAITNT